MIHLHTNTYWSPCCFQSWNLLPVHRHSSTSIIQHRQDKSSTRHQGCDMVPGALCVNTEAMFQCIVYTRAGFVQGGYQHLGTVRPLTNGVSSRRSCETTKMVHSDLRRFRVSASSALARQSRPAKGSSSSNTCSGTSKDCTERLLHSGCRQ